MATGLHVPDRGGPGLLYDIGLWLWVPAFAGTTIHDSCYTIVATRCNVIGGGQPYRVGLLSRGREVTNRLAASISGC
jgi:hypothetical protein